MYLSLVLLYLAFCLYFSAVWPFAALPAAIWLTHALAVRDEERRLRAAFGAAFDDYARRVRCWL